MTPEELEAIRARAELATPGPWSAYRSETVGWTIQIGNGWLFSRQSDKAGNYDAVFIAHARADIPALLAEVERLQRYIQSTGGDTVAPDAFTRLECIVHDQAREIERLQAENTGLRMDLIDTRGVLKTLPPGWLHGETGQDD